MSLVVLTMPIAPPDSAVSKRFVIIHKKTWECSTVSAYLRFQALALPLSKDKQLELAHVVHIITLSTQ